MNFKTKIASIAVVSGALVVGMATTNDAQAAFYSCNDVDYTTGNGADARTALNDGAVNESYAGCSYANGTSNASGLVVTAQAVLRASTAQTTGLISSRIASVANGSTGGLAYNKAPVNDDASAQDIASALGSFDYSSGVSSGDYLSGVGVWLSGSWSSVEDDTLATAFEGDVYTILGGADYQLDDRTLVGLAIGYEDTDIDTEYNRDITNNIDGKIEATGWTVAPYVSYKIDSMFSVQASAGYSLLDYDTTRYSGNGTLATTGSTDSSRYFIDVGGNARHDIDAFRLRGNLNYFFANEDKDSFTETEVGGATTTQASTETELGQARLGGELGYDLGTLNRSAAGIEPYAKAVLEWDVTKDDVKVGSNQVAPDDDDFGAELGGGIRFNAANGMSGSIEGTTIQFRDDYEAVTVRGNVRVQF